jgi:predicted metalloprotease
MRWRDGKRSSNVEDRRNTSTRRHTGLSQGKRKAAGGGLGVLLIVLVGSYFGVDLSPLLNGLQQTNSLGNTQSAAPTAPSGQQDQRADFVSVVLADTEDVWHTLFAQAGKRYQEPGLVLFSNTTSSACGHAQSAMGPFYCPADQKVYIDLQFYDDLQSRFGAPGDFAQAYVIAHEVGHHVQTLLGTSKKVRQAQSRANKAQANQLQVRMELQADCYAGLWAHHADKARQILEQGDVEEALNAAAAIGDDRLQQQAQGYVVPESFTHGSSKQRARWFREGLQYGKVSRCDTF